MTHRSNKAKRAARLAAIAIAVAGASAPAAEALPFYGYNAIQAPCSPWDDLYPPPLGCMNELRFSWFGNRPAVYRMRVDETIAYNYARRVGSASQWDWTIYDNAIARMRAHGVQPFVILTSGGVPGADESYLMPSTTAEWTRWRSFVRATVAHFGAAVQDYEIWNEPNAHKYNGPNRTSNPANRYNYAITYCYGAWGVRDSSSSARIYLGGIAQIGIGSSIGDDPQTWLQAVAKLYLPANCASAQMSGVSYHPYVYGGTPAVNATQMRNLLTAFRGYVNSYVTNGPGKYIMVTEYGHTAYDNSPPNQDEQNRQLIALSNVCWNNRDSLYIRACYWFPLQDVPGVVDLPTGGLVTAANASPPNAAKLSFWTFQSYLDTRNPY